MTQQDTTSQFEERIQRPAQPDGDSLWAFVVLPEYASAKLPRRGRTSIEGSINGHSFSATLEPDGQLSHWLRLNEVLLKTAGVNFGDIVRFEIRSVAEEPEPEIPADLQDALQAAPAARAVWNDTTPLARLDWIHWVTSAKQAKTRQKRILEACDKLSSGQRRVCCFDPSGYYSKAFSAPKAAD